MNLRDRFPGREDLKQGGEGSELDVLGSASRDAAQQFKVEIEGVTQGAFARQQPESDIDPASLLLPIEDLDFSVSDANKVIVMDQDLETEVATQATQQEIAIDHVGAGLVGKPVDIAEVERLDFSTDQPAPTAVEPDKGLSLEHLSGIEATRIPDDVDAANHLVLGEDEFVQDQMYAIDPLTEDHVEAVGPDDEIDDI
jgi:hypothetical protein